MKRFLSIILLAVSISAYGQKKPLDHTVYDGWKNIGGFKMTEDAKFSVFMINPQEGDGIMVSQNLKTGEKDTVYRANKFKLTYDGKFAVFNIKPKFEESKTARIKKYKADKVPKDSLGIYNLYTKQLKKIPFLKDFDIGQEGKSSFAFMTTPPADTSKSKKAPKKEKEEGSDLMVYTFANGITDTLKYITDYSYSKGGDSLFFVRIPNSKDSLYKNKAGLYLYIPATKALKCIYGTNAKQKVKLPEISYDSKSLAFYANLDTSKANKKDISILLLKEGYDKAKVIIDNKSAGLPKGWKVSEYRSLNFDRKAGRLFFGISPILPEKDTTIIESDVASLDIWHYAEPHIQPYQLLNASRELRKSYLSCIDLTNDNPTIVQLAKDDYEVVMVPNDWSSDWGYCASDKNYERESQWSANPHCDLYVISVKDGNSKAIVKDAYLRSVNASPDGGYLTWFNNIDMQWYSYENATGLIRNISKDIKTSLADELHDTPEMNFTYGHSGWAQGDKAFYVYDRYDVWQLDPKGEKAAVNLTDGLGRAEKKTFRIVRLDVMLLPPGTPGIKLTPIKPKEKIYFSVFDENTKDNGYYYKDMAKKNARMQKWVLEPFTFMYLTKSKDNSVITYVKHNCTNSPDMWITKDGFKTQKKVTDINPQQKSYNWCTDELVRWTSATGVEMDGILYKPENFDPTKKYPMIVYFYERNSQYLNYYRAPAPSASTVNVPYFASNGYLVFIPDICYQTGHPGKSALDCVVPGVEKICQNSWADRENVAIQGQSWGGYQVAYMVTQPQVFKWKAAGAGAPVSNMTSAYGGIRWGEGVVREFQYEHTQSRIGKTLWDGLDLYIENSPLFHADKIETPLLIMSNDKDEAVPWYQGIEYFTALRRLGKQAWMLQYNNETHNLSNRVNQKDLSIRLAQFFDHFLKGAPMPVWMKTGVPATKKGIDWGLDLTE